MADLDMESLLGGPAGAGSATGRATGGFLSSAGDAAGGAGSARHTGAAGSVSAGTSIAQAGETSQESDESAIWMTDLRALRAGRGWWDVLLLLGFSSARREYAVHLRTTAAARARSRRLSRVDAAGGGDGRDEDGFGPGMFRSSNELGLACVLHFLFTRWRPALARTLRLCFPPLDVEAKRQWRSEAANVLADMAESGRIPRALLRASLLTSATGERIDELLTQVTTVVGAAVLARGDVLTAGESGEMPAPPPLPEVVPQTETGPRQKEMILEQLPGLQREMWEQWRALAARKERIEQEYLSWEQATDKLRREEEALADAEAAQAEAEEAFDAVHGDPADTPAVEAELRRKSAAVEHELTALVDAVRQPWFREAERVIEDTVERLDRPTPLVLDGVGMRAALIEHARSKAGGAATSASATGIDADDGYDEPALFSRDNVDVVEVVKAWGEAMETLCNAVVASWSSDDGAPPPPLPPPKLVEQVTSMRARLAAARQLASDIATLGSEVDASVELLSARLDVARSKIGTQPGDTAPLSPAVRSPTDRRVDDADLMPTPAPAMRGPAAPTPQHAYAPADLAHARGATPQGGGAAVDTPAGRGRAAATFRNIAATPVTALRPRATRVDAHRTGGHRTGARRAGAEDTILERSHEEESASPANVSSLGRALGVAADLSSIGPASGRSRASRGARDGSPTPLSFDIAVDGVVDEAVHGAAAHGRTAADGNDGAAGDDAVISRALSFEPTPAPPARRARTQGTGTAGPSPSPLLSRASPSAMEDVLFSGERDEGSADDVDVVAGTMEGAPHAAPPKLRRLLRDLVAEGVVPPHLGGPIEECMAAAASAGDAAQLRVIETQLRDFAALAKGSSGAVRP